MKKYFTTKGRFPRSVFWKYHAVFCAGILFIGLLDGKMKFSESARAVEGWVMLPFLLVGLIVQIKRWQDLDKSGAWVLINFIPIIGPFWTLAMCGGVKGTPGPNRYGPDPLSENLPEPTNVSSTPSGYRD